VCVSVGVGARALACACVRVALLVQRATRIHQIVSGISGSTRYFDIILQTARFSGGKKVTEDKMCFLFSIEILFETCLILRRIQRDIAINPPIYAWLFKFVFSQIAPPPPPISLFACLLARRRSTCPACLTLLDLIIRITFCKPVGLAQVFPFLVYLHICLSVES
jgi:hypothetical protein